MIRHLEIHGGLLTGSMLDRIAAGDPRLPGTAPDSYHHDTAADLNQAIHRSWLALTGRWAAFKSARDALPVGDRATTLTRERWLMPLLTELGFGRLPAERPVEIDGRSFPVSYRWAHVPIHLVGAGDSLDKPPAGSRGVPSPHGLVQDLLNSVDDRLWGLLSNGLELRLLRDHRALTRQAFVSFDVEAIFEEEAFAGFRLLWLLCHQSRFEGTTPSECTLELWFRVLADDGVPAMDRMRDGVEEALVRLGTGFLRHGANVALVARLHAGNLSPQDYYRQLLRLVYRLIFLCVAERRGLLLDPAATDQERSRYDRLYAVERLRLRAGKRRGDPHGDAWIALRLVMRLLDRGHRPLGLPALGSFLWREEAIADLDAASLMNEDLFAAMRALCEVQDGQVRRPVDWSSLQSDELGSVYESLMERVPRVQLATGTLELTSAVGNERKTTGSYYTPISLVDCLLDSALDPVLDGACARPNPEAALLDLAVVDPACGSGHFLVAAARRIAMRVARVRCGGVEPSPPEVQHALREVVSRCIYGVDINPMAVELCKVSLWMEALEPGKPLSFLDAHIRCGNALLGTTPALMKDGIPDSAWEFIEGDEKDVCKRLKKANRESAQGALFGAGAGAISVDMARNAVGVLTRPDAYDDATRDAVETKERAFRAAETSEPVRAARLLADLWCAAFIWPKTAGDGETFAPTKAVWDRVKGAPLRMPERLREIVEKLRGRYAFVHWHLSFPRVMERGGFDVVLGNPPWDSLLFREEEFFAERRPDIAQAPTAAARKRAIGSLEAEDPALFAVYRDEGRRSAAVNAFVRNGPRYPLCGVGRVNLYGLFAELARQLVAATGRAAQILPSGIVSDDSTKAFFQDAMDRGELVSFLDFENREGLFPAVDSRFRFGILTRTGGGARLDDAEFAFYATRPEQARDPQRRFSLSAADIALLNPETRTCPIFRTRLDAEIARAVYRRVPILRESGWDLTLRRLLNSADDSADFVEAPGDGLLPLYEGKYFHHFDHRWLTSADGDDRAPLLAERQDPEFQAHTRHWFPATEATRRFGAEWGRPWLLAWRDITNPTNERTFIAAALPSTAVPHTAKVAYPPEEVLGSTPFLIGVLGSLVLDFFSRQKVGGTHMSAFIVEQLPVLDAAMANRGLDWLADESIGAFVRSRVMELTYTAWDLEPFARDMGFTGPPFRWDEARRPMIRAELDALFFHLYGLSRDEAAYVLDTFRVLRRNEERAHGEYRTVRLVLDAFDAMARARDGGGMYASPLDPPPADSALRHPPRGDA